MVLRRDQILGFVRLQHEDVSVPEWGGTVRIREMTGLERDAWEQSLVGRGGSVDTANIRARLVSICAVDEEGQPLFTADDATALGALSGAALDRCAKVAQRLNRMTKEDVEGAQGNSAGAPSATSTSS